MRNPKMRDDVTSHMQALLYDPTPMTKEEERSGLLVGLWICLPLIMKRGMKSQSACMRIHLNNASLKMHRFHYYLKRRRGMNLRILIVMQLHGGGSCKLHHQGWRKGNQLKCQSLQKWSQTKGKNVREGGRRHHLLHPFLHLHWAIIQYSSPLLSKDEEFDFSQKWTNGRGKGKKAYGAKECSWRYCRFKEGEKSITYLTYDGTFGAMDKVLAFIQQYDVASRDEFFFEYSNLRNVAMHFTKSVHQWWSGLYAQGRAPRTWKALCLAIMKSFLDNNAKTRFS